MLDAESVRCKPPYSSSQILDTIAKLPTPGVSSAMRQRRKTSSSLRAGLRTPFAKPWSPATPATSGPSVFNLWVIEALSPPDLWRS